MSILATNRIFRPLLVPTLTVLVALPILIGLGTWQVQRLHWKQGLIADLEARMAADPIAFPPQADWSIADWQALAFRTVSVEGRYLNEHEFHVFRQNQDGDAAYRLVTPLKLNAGGYVFVDRGFVPAPFKDPALRPDSRREGEVEVVGLVRAPEEEGYFDVVQNAESNEWTRRMPATFAEVADLAPVAPYLIEAEREEPKTVGLPIAEPAPLNIRNNHLEYAITWFSLAVGLVAVYLAYHIANGRVGPPRPSRSGRRSA